MFKQQKLPLTQTIPFKNEELNYIVLGAKGTGKSSLLNYLFKTKEEVGIQQEQDEAKSVILLPQKIVLWQVPANAEYFEFLSEDIRIFQNVQRIFLLYDGSLTSHEAIIKWTNKLKPRRCKLYLVRTKTDILKQSEGTVEQEMKIDRKTLNNWKVEPTQHLSISTKATKYQYDMSLLNLLLATP